MIHKLAVVDPAAELDQDVEVGPFTVIGPGVEIGRGTRIDSHVVIKGPTRIGRNNRIHQFASLGEAPQDKSYKGEPTRLEVGDDNVIREYVTLNRGTTAGGGCTRLGNNNYLMAYTHLAHDCQVGDHTIFANAASLAGHVTVDDWVIMGGFAIVHQFCRIGAHSFCALGSVVFKDVPPYTTVSGNPAKPHGINAEGLRRRGFSADSMKRLRQAYKTLYKSKLPLSRALEELRYQAQEADEIQLLTRFLEQSRRSIVR
ncbi:MAG: acyl-ACP--UDP-N-acetylglucosamine O-acyltransferase [Gammaproteobacteria bacterium]